MSLSRAKALAIAMVIGMILGAAVGAFLTVYNFADFEKLRRPKVAIRVDDVQNWFHVDVVRKIVELHLSLDQKLTLALIAGSIGNDPNLTKLLRQTAENGYELADHGLLHVDYSNLTLEQQLEYMKRSKEIIANVTGIMPVTFVAPMYLYNENTIKAMKAVDYKILSSYIALQEPKVSKGADFQHIPATVELSNFANGIWREKSLDTLLAEVVKSVAMHGHAVLVVHPQEFVDNEGNIVESRWKTYEDLVKTLHASYELTTLKALAGVE